MTSGAAKKFQRWDLLTSHSVLVLAKRHSIITPKYHLHS